MGGPVLFGVRHLSPGAAYHLRQALDEAQPRLVLVEGPSDLNEQMHWLCHRATQFPAAIMAYTKTPPVRTILYPFAIYSPEIQAILWVYEHGAECRFMDLPSSVFLALQAAAEERAIAEMEATESEPEAEIEIVESSLPGDTIEGAAAFALKERAEASTSIAQAAAIFSDAFLCGMPEAAKHALSVLQGLSVDAAVLAEVAATAEQLSLVVRYGGLRQFDAAPVVPLLEQLYLRACLTLEDACICDAQAAPAVTQAIDRLNTLQLNHDFLDQDMWLKLLERVSNRDDLNTRCSGFAMAALLERGAADEELLAREVSRRLSPGVPADLGAGWFEGLAGKNRYALIARLSLWRHLDEYLQGLDEEDFRRALVFLRRAFADFSPAEKNDIAENLGEIWGVNAQQAAEILMNGLTEAEQEVLSGLDEFDFDDI